MIINRKHIHSQATNPTGIAKSRSRQGEGMKTYVHYFVSLFFFEYFLFCRLLVSGGWCATCFRVVISKKGPSLNRSRLRWIFAIWEFRFVFIEMGAATMLAVAWIEASLLGKKVPVSSPASVEKESLSRVIYWTVLARKKNQKERFKEKRATFYYFIGENENGKQTMKSAGKVGETPEVELFLTLETLRLNDLAENSWQTLETERKVFPYSLTTNCVG